MTFTAPTSEFSLSLSQFAETGRTVDRYFSSDTLFYLYHDHLMSQNFNLYPMSRCGSCYSGAR